MSIIERGESFYQPMMQNIVDDLESKGEREVGVAIDQIRAVT